MSIKNIKRGKQRRDINREKIYKKEKYGKWNYKEGIYSKKRVIQNIQKKNKYRKKTNTRKKLYRKKIQ